MTRNVHEMLSVDHYSPEEVLNPASVTGRDRIALTRALESMGIDRLTVERGRDYQTLRRDSDGWYMTCRNSRY